MLKRVISALALHPTRDLPSLLACFAPIDTHGPASLYRQLFLGGALVDPDPAFGDNGYGEFLTAGTGEGAPTISGHEEALRAACQLTGEELSAITAALGSGEAALSLEAVSAIFRHGWLARRLELSVREFLLLKTCSGIDPFAPSDAPHPPMLRFIELVGRLRQASLKPVEALYLIWNQDISGKSEPPDSQVAQLARSLRATAAATEREFSNVDDPSGEIARTRMAMAYGEDASRLFFGLLDNTFVVEVEYTHAEAKLQDTIKAAAAPGVIAYDDFRKRLSFGGLLSEDVRDRLSSAEDATPGFRNAILKLHDASYVKVAKPFFDRYPELWEPCKTYLASSQPVGARLTDLLAALLLDLKTHRKEQQALQLISAAAGAEFGFSAAVLGEPSVLHVAHDLAALDAHGLAAKFFYADSVTGAADHENDAEANLCYTEDGLATSATIARSRSRAPGPRAPGGLNYLATSGRSTTTRSRT